MLNGVHVEVIFNERVIMVAQKLSFTLGLPNFGSNIYTVIYYSDHSMVVITHLGRSTILGILALATVQTVLTFTFNLLYAANFPQIALPSV